MGIVNFGISEKEVDFLKKIMGLDVFVEGGTYEGGTAKKMSHKFRKVYTIEKSNEMYDIAKQNLKEIPNITMIKGDTREHINHILEGNDNMLFWLDAHWSGGLTYGERDECPLAEELKTIFKHRNKNYVIMIDDARYFLSPPPFPHSYKNWYSIKDILNIIPQNWDFIVYEDVIYLYPLQVEDKLKQFFQETITIKSQKPPPNIFQNVFKKLGLCRC